MLVLVDQITDRTQNIKQRGQMSPLLLFYFLDSRIDDSRAMRSFAMLFECRGRCPLEV